MTIDEEAVASEMRQQLEEIPAGDAGAVGLEEVVPPPALPGRTRLTVTESIYHQSPEGEPVEIGYSGARFLETDEQVYSRRTTVGEEWTPIDCGWLRESGASLLLLRNEEGRFTQVIPSPEQRGETQGRVVEVGVGTPHGEVVPFAEVDPQESPLRLRPSDLGSLYLRCRQGRAKVTVTLVPR